jgi:hypothetical protein
MRQPAGYVRAVIVLSVTLVAAASAAPEDDAAALQKMVEADWTAQEKRLGREPHSNEAIREALRRVERLLEDRHKRADTARLGMEKELAALKAEKLDALDEAGRLALYRRIRTLGRSLALQHPTIAGKPIVFLKQRRFICQMLHEYVGYYYNYANIAGGGPFVLEQPGRSLKTRDLLASRLPRGSYTTPALSYDGRTVYFAFCEVPDVPRPHAARENWHGMPAADRVPTAWNYYSPERACFQIYAVGTDGNNVRRLSRGPFDEFDPCPLPDGGLAFMSSRRGGYCRCNNDFEPLPTYTLHRMEADGRNVRTLSYHETNEWHPAVLNDGRIVYSRWDYVDRSAAHFHGLWACNPDGSNPHILFGNYTQRISACYQPRAVPGSNKIAFIAGAHHANVGGSLVLFDPAKTRLDAKTGEDRFDSIERLTPEVCFPEAPNEWPKSFFNTPWPLSEDHFLVAFGFDTLPGMSSGNPRDSKTGIYYFDRYGNLELLYRDTEFSCVGPMPLAARPAPPVIPPAADPALGEEGEFLLSNVEWSLMPLPEKRPVRALRVFQVLPKTGSHVANRPRLGYANAESARMLLGEVPVEADGSAYFRAPAGKLLYFQAVDAAGYAVQTMRSGTYLQPGERRGCVGCHEPMATTAAVTAPIPAAARRGPSTISPGPDGTAPMSFPRLVQPVLDRHCVRCHDGTTGEGKSKPALGGGLAGEFTRSYESLRPFVRWYEWGGSSIAQIVTPPGRCGADESRLLKVLGDADHAAVKLPPEDRRRLILWLDSNAPFYGTYNRDEQQAQRKGLAVPPPKVQ